MGGGLSRPPEPGLTLLLPALVGRDLKGGWGITPVYRKKEELNNKTLVISSNFSLHIQ